MSSALCRLNAVLPPGARRAPVARAHARSCLRCQAMEARRRGLRRGLDALGDEVLAAPPYLAAAVMSRLGDQRSRPGRPRRDARLARIAAAGAGVGAAAAAAVLTGVALRKARTPA
ncbi:MAG: hypothetical protein KQH83_12735 [Actinobacteria bacterium]|nr:hypothetical protein [Actinomycetota bacterium]